MRQAGCASSACDGGRGDDGGDAKKAAVFECGEEGTGTVPSRGDDKGLAKGDGAYSRFGSMVFRGVAWEEEELDRSYED